MTSKAHGRNPGYRPGDHWFVDDLDGREYRVSDGRKTWDGKIVHKSHWEPRQPQDFVRGLSDDIVAKGLVRPEPIDRFTDVQYPFSEDDPDRVIPPPTFNE